MIINLGQQLPVASSDLPGSSGGPPSNTPLHGLAPDGVCLASPVTRGTGELLPRLFTLTPRQARGGMFSVALSLGSPPVAVSDHPALWSSDFPPARRRASDHPACSDTVHSPMTHWSLQQVFT